MSYPQPSEIWYYPDSSLPPKISLPAGYPFFRPFNSSVFAFVFPYYWKFSSSVSFFFYLTCLNNQGVEFS